MSNEKKAERWADLAEVRARYKRSVHLERDAAEGDWLDGYVVTPLVRRVAARVVRGMTSKSTARAWSLTGPYGSGKSAFALFLANVLALPEERSTKKARAVLKQNDVEAWKGLFARSGAIGSRDGLCVVLATGERRPLEHILLPALRSAAKRFWEGGKPPSVIKDLDRAIARTDKGETVAPSEVVRLFKAVADRVRESKKPGRGLLIILDEAGKPLEFAASSPAQGDIQLLQELAELANRSGDTPIVFVTLLHQAFEQYAGRLGIGRRNEWAKVQGRFEDVPFRESTDQILRLIDSAIDQRDAAARIDPREMKAVKSLAEVVNIAERDPGEDLSTLLEGCVPLHPLVALALGPLFRSKLAQNERSLFAFLGAAEPLGFQKFLEQSVPNEKYWPTYTIDRLYDYLSSAWGSRLYGHDGRRWAQIDDALRRLPSDSEEVDARLVKCVGLLGFVADAIGLPVSESTLCCALRAYTPRDKQRIKDAIRRLHDASIIVFRKYRRSYQLWEGSDLELEDLIQRAHARGELRTSLTERIARIAPPRPLVARRHLLETGTLRYFDLRYTDESILDGDFGDPTREEDGILYFVVPSSDHAEEQARKLLAQPMLWSRQGKEQLPVIFALPSDSDSLRELAQDVGALEWVLSNTPELQGDPVARRELDVRLADAESGLRNSLTALMAGERPCEWYCQGKKVELSSMRALSSYLSDLCSTVYRSAPYIHNEMLNRRHVSSTSAAARRNLLEAMVDHGDRQGLGFEGTPAEVSMYRSFLVTHDLHRPIDDEWQFCPPTRPGRGSLQAAHRAVRRMLEGTERAPLAVGDIYARLRRPPFGMKDGVLPVFVLSTVLELEDEIAVYEEGRFVPRLTGATLERLLRTPAKFQLQQFRIEGARADLFTSLTRALTGIPKKRRGSLVPVVTQLVKIVNGLSDYARHTGHLPETARNVRQVLIRAKEPGTLIFEQLPTALGLPPFKEGAKPAKSTTNEFLVGLRDALDAIGVADQTLLNKLKTSLARSFSREAAGTDLRTELALRAQRISGIVAEPRLKSFCLRLADPGLSDDDWVTSWATLLSGKPPENWRDPDTEQTEVMLDLLARKFETFEALGFHLSTEDEDSDTELVRLSVAQPGAPELARVIAVRESDTAAVERARSALAELARGLSGDSSRDQVLAALALAAQDILSQYDNGTVQEQPSEKP